MTQPKCQQRSHSVLPLVLCIMLSGMLCLLFFLPLIHSQVSPDTGTRTAVGGDTTDYNGVQVLVSSDVPDTSTYRGPTTGRTEILSTTENPENTTGRIPGVPGPPGDIGEPGPLGAPGVVGPVGPAGNPGPPGSPGVMGERGERGPSQPGPSGGVGPDGRRGFYGLPGVDGSPGPRGEAGGQGHTGSAGQSGLLGEVGLLGPLGPRGGTGESGDEGPTGSSGAVGPPGLFEDSDQCELGVSLCEHHCVDTRSGYQCACRAGHQLDENGFNCSDIDECLEDNGGCEQWCLNTEGSRVCGCDHGFSLSKDTRTCIDVDECCTNRLLSLCRLIEVCVNTRGGFYCLDSRLVYKPADIYGSNVSQVGMMEPIRMGDNEANLAAMLLKPEVLIGLLIWASLLTLLFVIIILLGCSASGTAVTEEKHDPQPRDSIVASEPQIFIFPRIHLGSSRPNLTSLCTPGTLKALRPSQSFLGGANEMQISLTANEAEIARRRSVELLTSGRKEEPPRVEVSSHM